MNAQGKKETKTRPKLSLSKFGGDTGSDSGTGTSMIKLISVTVTMLVENPIAVGYLVQEVARDLKIV